MGGRRRAAMVRVSHLDRGRSRTVRRGCGVPGAPRDGRSGAVRSGRWPGRLARRDPMWPFRRARARPRGWRRAGHRVAPSRAAAARRGRLRARSSAASSLIGGLFLAWLAFATPVLTGLTPAAPAARSRPARDRRRRSGGSPSSRRRRSRSSARCRIGRVARALTAKPTGAGRDPGRPSRSATTTSPPADVRLPDGRVDPRPRARARSGWPSSTSCRRPRTTRHTGGSWEIRRAGRPLGPLREPARADGARRRAGPALVRLGRARLRREGLRGASSRPIRPSAGPRPARS